jgi:hypothetical protein
VAKGNETIERKVKAMMKQFMAKQNNLSKTYVWNKSIEVRPYSVNTAIAISADDCDFTGRLGHLEPNIRRLRS